MNIGMWIWHGLAVAFLFVIAGLFLRSWFGWRREVKRGSECKRECRFPSDNGELKESTAMMSEAVKQMKADRQRRRESREATLEDLR